MQARFSLRSSVLQSSLVQNTQFSMFQIRLGQSNTLLTMCYKGFLLKVPLEMGQLIPQPVMKSAK